MAVEPPNPGRSVKMPYSDEVPPQMSVSLPSIRDVKKTRAKDPSYAPLPVDVMLLTVYECEFLACYSQLINPFRCWFDNIGFVYFEGLGENVGADVTVALIRCNESYSGLGSALVKNSVIVLRPKAVIFVGVCSSLKPQKAKLGDVVVSASLTMYDYMVATSDQEPWAATIRYESRYFHKIVHSTAHGYNAPLQNPEARKIRVHGDGEFFSGPEHVRAKWHRLSQLAKPHPRAIAFCRESEGEPAV